MKTFLDICLAKIQGEDAKAQSLQIQKRATAHIRAQIAAKEGAQIDLEETVTDREEAVDKAMVNNGKKITKGEDYMERLFGAQGDLEDAQEKLSDHKGDIAFLKQSLDRVKSSKITAVADEAKK